jgi:hypothetical protein
VHRHRAVTALALGALSLLLFACVERVGGPEGGAPIERACVGLPESMIDQGVADLRSNFDGAASLREGAGYKTLPTLVGAQVQIRAVPGMTAQWLRRTLQCDTARHADAALVPARAVTEVVGTPTGFTIYVRSTDPELARDIEGRANLFAHPNARCNTPAYHWNEAFNAGGPGRCTSDCQCDGARTCGGGTCGGTAR